MKSRKIILEKMKAIDLKRMDLLATKIAKENNKSKAYVKFDMVRNFLKYKMGYTDYFKSNYINLTKKQKEDFVTSKNFFNILAYLNPREYRMITKDKLIFNQIFKDYIKRDFLDIRTSDESKIKEFLKGKENVFAKPSTDFGGHHIEKIKVKDIKDIKEFKENLIKNNQFLLEEEIIQAKELNKMNPHTVNTFRVVTLYNKGEVHVLGNFFRLGLDDNPALQCRDANMIINEDGTPASEFVDDDGVVYDKHPLTGYDLTKIKKFPYIKESYEMCKEAALLIPEIRYIGWDIALTDKGPVMIEGNEYPSYGPIQNYMLKKDNPGHLKQIKDILGEEFKNIDLNN